MKYIRFVSVLILFLASCGPDCKEDAELNWRPVQLKMIVKNKERRLGKEFFITGKDSLGKFVQFPKTLWREVYEAVEVGDTLSKQKGMLEVDIYRSNGDTGIVKYMCRDGVYE